jgi:UDP-N-acetylglucosamine acyltransferase
MERTARGSGVHPSAIVARGAQIADDVEIGPYAIVGENVRIGAGTRVGSHAYLDGWTEIGPGCRIHPFAVVGTEPQDLKFRGEASQLVIGARTTIREFATLNRATEEGAATVVGEDCLIMAYAHVAHNCVVGSHVILANSSALAGHVTVQNQVSISALTPIHQFVHIGRLAYIGGGSRVPQDIPPFVLAAGNPLQMGGLNSVGMQRRGISPESQSALKRVYRLFYRSGLTTEQALAAIARDVEPLPEVLEFTRFIEEAEGRPVPLKRGVQR